MVTKKNSCRLVCVCLFLGMVVAVVPAAWAGESAGSSGESQRLGEYVWGPRIARADLLGRVVVCLAYSGTDQNAGALPGMMAKLRGANVALFLVLLEEENLARALRFATAGPIKAPIVAASLKEAQKLFPDLKVEPPSNARGRGKKGGSRGKQGKYQTTALIRTPDGTVAYCGKVDRTTTMAVLDHIKKAAQDFPCRVTEGEGFSKFSSVVRKLCTGGKYASVMKSLKDKLKSKDSTESDQARRLMHNIEVLGEALLAKAAYFEAVHPPAAQDCYTQVSKQFAGLPAGDTASKRLKALKADKKLKVEIAAAKVAARIRQQCGLLNPPRPDAPVDLGNADFRKHNKKVVPKLLRDAALLKKKYGETVVGEECLKLLGRYGMPTE